MRGASMELANGWPTCRPEIILLSRLGLSISASGRIVLENSALLALESRDSIL